mgnify:CR=1 FL=1
MKSDRIRRVNEILKRELSDRAEKLISSEVDALATITEVHTSADLRHAEVFVSVMGDAAQQAKALRVFKKHRSEFQTAIARRIPIKFTPVLKFKIDATQERADRILSIIEELDVDETSDS